jgi:thioredoxin 1
MKKAILTVVTLAALLLNSFAGDFPKGSPAFSTSYEAVVAKAKASGKPIIIVFSAGYCPPCQEMKKNVYPSGAVKAYHDKFEWAYLDTEDPANGAAAEKYKVQAIPHIQFTTAKGKAHSEIVGGMEPADFASVLEKMLNDIKS